MAAAQADPPIGPSPYGPGSAHSFFLDPLWASGHEALRGATPPPPVGSVQAASARLRVARGPYREARDLTTSATAGGGFGASSAIPNYLADLFSVSLKNAGVLAPRLEQRPLPARGMTLTAGRLSTAASTTPIAAENAAVVEQDPTTATITSPVCTVSGQIDVSEQLLSRAAPTFDEIAAKELGTLFAEDLDGQLLNGSGSGGQLTGLLDAADVTAVTATTATAAANLATVAKAYDLAGVAAGVAPDTTVLHPRRLGFIKGTIGYAPAWPASGELIEAPGMPVTLTTNRDAIVMFARSEVVLLTSPLSVRVAPNPLSSTLTARITRWAYCALLVRSPASVAVITGAGLASPTYSV